MAPSNAEKKAILAAAGVHANGEPSRGGQKKKRSAVAPASDDSIEEDEGYPSSNQGDDLEGDRVSVARTGDRVGEQNGKRTTCIRR